MILTRHAPITFDIPTFSLPTPTTATLDEAFVTAADQAWPQFPMAITDALARLAAGNEVAGNQAAGNEVAGNQAAGNQVAGNEVAGNEVAGNEAAGNEVAGNQAAGAVLLRGLPVGVIPMTPATPVTPSAKCGTSELVLLAVARHLGEPVGYAPEHGGRIVQNIVPVQTSADRQVSTSSTVMLEFHTETAFHPHKPHYLLLLCLRGDAGAATTLCSVASALELLTAEVIATLREPRFRTRPDASFLTDPATLGDFGPAAPILTGSTERPTFTFDADLMIGIDLEAQAAIEALRRAVKVAHVSVVLEAGDLLVIDNHAAVHGRTPFAARYDGTDRWVQRTFVVDDLAASANDRSGRVITTTFR